MATDMYIRFDGVDGESTQKGLEKWIELGSYAMSSRTEQSTELGEGSGVGKVTIDGVSFHTVTGRHTPQIFTKMCSGNHFPVVEIKFLKQTGAEAAETYYHLKMEKVFVTSNSVSKSPGSLPGEGLHLTAETYEQEYWVQGGDGGLNSVGKTKYNSKTNVIS